MLTLAATELIALLVLSLSVLQTGARPAPVGRAEAGKTYWDQGEAAMGHCSRCHGLKGEGAYGPDLAGRGLNVEEFRHAVRQPWGVMPAMTEMQMSDQLVADIAAYLGTLPKVKEPGPWRTPLPANAPLGQQILIATAGCGQCHGPEFAAPRRTMGAEGGDYQWLATRVYEHSSVYPRGFMGNFSKTRLPEPLLRELWRFVSVDLGPRASIRAALDAGARSGATVTYTLNLENAGLAGKGIAAEEVSISVPLPKGVSVAGTTGDGYQGVRRDPSSNVEMAMWTVRSIAAGEKQTFTLTVAGASPDTAIGKGSNVHWARPPLREGVPNIVTHDDSTPVRLP